MLETTVEITNTIGLHARPASLLVKAAQEFSCAISLRKGEKTVDAKSIIGIMSAAIRQGEVITLQVNGEDEQQALRVIKALLESGLDGK
jgi:phosphocarrier protein